MMKRRRGRADGRPKKRRKARKAKYMAVAAVSRIAWMIRTRGCPHICLLCEYYRQCREDGTPEKGDGQK